MVKKTKNSAKTPEKSISEKVNYYKGVTKTLRKRIDNLEKRMSELETRMSKEKCIKSEKEKNIKTDVKDDFNKKFNPSYKEKK